MSARVPAGVRLSSHKKRTRVLLCFLFSLFLSVRVCLVSLASLCLPHFPSYTRVYDTVVTTHNSPWYVCVYNFYLKLFISACAQMGLLSLFCLLCTFVVHSVVYWRFFFFFFPPLFVFVCLFCLHTWMFSCACVSVCVFFLLLVFVCFFVVVLVFSAVFFCLCSGCFTYKYLKFFSVQEVSLKDDDGLVA